MPVLPDILAPVSHACYLLSSGAARTAVAPHSAGDRVPPAAVSGRWRRCGGEQGCAGSTSPQCRLQTLSSMRPQRWSGTDLTNIRTSTYVDEYGS